MTKPKNAELIAEARAKAADPDDYPPAILLTELCAALEAAEAELTRRDTVIAEALGHGRRLSIGAIKTGGEPLQGMLATLAAAPVSLEAVKAETTADPAWSELLSNDGEYEYTSTGNCDGSRSWFWRRRPALHRDAGEWEAITADEHRAASVKWDGYGARAETEGVS